VRDKAVPGKTRNTPFGVATNVDETPITEEFRLSQNDSSLCVRAMSTLNQQQEKGIANSSQSIEKWVKITIF
jgi:hypothetical protein